jgi:hypothetical protein
MAELNAAMPVSARRSPPAPEDDDSDAPRKRQKVKPKQKRNKPTLSCQECVDRKTKVRLNNVPTCDQTEETAAPTATRYGYAIPSILSVLPRCLHTSVVSAVDVSLVPPTQCHL